MVIWLTGLSASGKTTIGKRLEVGLERFGYKTILLDGDDLRDGLCSDLGFSYEDRIENIRRIRHIAKLLSDNGMIVIVAAITPYNEMRLDNIELIGNKYIEVHVDASIETCIERDFKGLYNKKDINMTGIDDIYEVPICPSITCNTYVESVNESVAKVMDYVYEKFFARSFW